MTSERTITTPTHGRYVVDIVGPPAANAAGRDLLIVGFHGYGEQCAIQMERLRELRGTLPWTLVSVQALHRFYRRGGKEIVASWMTRQDRELMIADNIAYIDAVIDEVAGKSEASRPLVFAGFSQGASMAYRAAVLGRHTVAAVIAVGGDVPPELSSERLVGIPRALLGWGVRDTLFTRGTRERDERRLRDAGVGVTVVELDAAHEWTRALNDAAREFLSAPG